MAETDTTSTPMLHHLDKSQSQRILWLLEELECPYNIKAYFRQRGRAPPELAIVHPLGRAPVLVTESGRVISESSAIASYLITTYDTTGKFQPSGKDGMDLVRDEMLTSFANASFLPTMVQYLILDIIGEEATPFLFRPLVRIVTGAAIKGFVEPGMKKMLEFLEAELGERQFFMGGKDPGRADFMLEFPFSLIMQRGWNDLSEYPKLKRWRETCMARPAWKEGLGKGNGYNLTKFA